MLEKVKHFLLEEKACQEIGTIRIKEICFEIFWSQKDKVQLDVFANEHKALVRGTRFYFLQGYKSEDETSWAKSLNRFMDLLENLGEAVSIFYHRSLAEPEEIQHRARIKNIIKSNDNLSLNELEQRIKKLEWKGLNLHREISSKIGFLNMLSQNSNSFESNYLRREISRLKHNLELCEQEKKIASEQENTLLQYLNEYKKKGAIASLLFEVFSSPRIIQTVKELALALSAIISELNQIEHYHLQPRLRALNIFVSLIDHPPLLYSYLWLTGLIKPSSMRDARGEFEKVAEMQKDLAIVYPISEIDQNSGFRDYRQLYGPYAFSAFLKRMDRIEAPIEIPKLPEFGGWLGWVEIGQKTVIFCHPFGQFHHYVSGTTRSGKTFLARVIVENALLSGIKVLILDPTRQWAGLSKSNPEFYIPKKILEQLQEKIEPKGFSVKIYTPAKSAGLSLPSDLTNLFKHSSVVSFKGCEDKERLEIIVELLKVIYQNFQKESSTIKLLLVIEEAHSLLPKNVNPSAQEIAKEVRALLIRIARESLKFGVSLLIITQSLRDFSRDDAILREMIGCRFFLKSTDSSEIEYIINYLGKEGAELVKNLKLGEAVVQSPFVNGINFKVRPILSHLQEMNDDEIRKANQGWRIPPEDWQETMAPVQTDLALSERECKVLELAKEYMGRFGKPLPLVELDKNLGVARGGSRERLIKALEEKGLIRKIKIFNERGRPGYGIIITEGFSSSPEQIREQTRNKNGTNDL